MKAILGFPLLLSTGAFVLSLLSLMAGFKQGFLEDYNVMTLNTSALGEDAIRAIANGSISSTALSSLGVSSSQASSLINSLSGQIVSDLASQLGIGEFYTIHAMDFCQGNFEPNSTTGGATHNVTFCSAPLDFAAYNLTDKLQKELSVGPFNFTLSTLGISEDTQSKLGYLPIVAKVLAGLFIVTLAATGVSMLLTLLGFLLIPNHAPRRLSFLNMGAALAAVIFTLASSLVATFVPRAIASQLQESLGSTVGLEIIANMKLATMLWAACGMTALSTVSWFGELIVQCVRRRRMRRYSSYEQKFTSSFEK